MKPNKTKENYHMICCHGCYELGKQDGKDLRLNNFAEKIKEEIRNSIELRKKSLNFTVDIYEELFSINDLNIIQENIYKLLNEEKE